MKNSENGSALGVVITAVLLVGVAIVSYKAGQGGLPVGTALTETAFSGSSHELVDTDPKTNPVLARIDGAEIRRSDVTKLVNTMPPQMRQIPLEQLLPLALEQAINNKIIDARTKAANLENDPDVQKQIKQARLQIVRGKYVENEIKARLTDERLKASYDEYTASFAEEEEVKAAHILVDDEKLAKNIIAKLNNGGDFAALAKEHSKDGSAEGGGVLGYFTATEVVPEFAEVAFATEVGSYTKKPVQSQFGYHVIRIDEKRKRPPQPFETVRPLIEQELQRSILDEVVDSWKTAAQIERFGPNGNPIQPDSALPVVEEAPVSEPAAGDDDSATEEAVNP